VACAVSSTSHIPRPRLLRHPADSKLMVVDDRVVVLGSANINDRSQYGDRDSEVAALVYGGDEMDSVMDGRPWKASAFAVTLRRNLWEEHLGIPHTCAAFAANGGNRMDNAHVPVAPLKQLALTELQDAPCPGGAADLRLRTGAASEGCCGAAGGEHARRGSGLLTPRPQLVLGEVASGHGARTAAGDGGALTLVTATPLDAVVGVDAAAADSAESGPRTDVTTAPAHAEEAHPPAIVAASTTALSTEADLVTPPRRNSYGGVDSLAAAKSDAGGGAEAALDPALEADLRQRHDDVVQAVRAACRDRTGGGGAAAPCAVDVCVDPLAPGNLWHHVASLNTAVYEAVFPGVISDRIKTLRQWRAAEALPPAGTHVLPLTVGKLVLWSTRFLEEEDLSTRPTEKEHFIPVKVVQ
jgi:hypothetical protein